MNSILTFLLRRGLLLAAAAALLMTPFMAATSYAEEVPIKISYTGSLVPIPVNYGSVSGASVMIAQSRGSFGASMSHVVTEWVEDTGTCEGDYTGYGHYHLLHAAMIITFSNDDQLFSVGADWLGGADGWMCMNAATGHFVGEAGGEFTGGTGRFEGAGGTFLAPFSGYNLAYFGLGYGAGPITGTIKGTVVFP
jgi:hypothetical protein